MSWQAYKQHRFQKTRRNLYKGDIRDSFFPFEPGLVSVYLAEDLQNQSALEALIASLFSQTYQKFEILIMVRNEKSYNNLLSNLPTHWKQKIKLHSFHETEVADHRYCPIPKGEFFSRLESNYHFSPDCYERMVVALRQNLLWNLVYIKNQETDNPLGCPFLIRSKVAWVLGENCAALDSQANYPYWQQAGLALNLKAFDISVPTFSASRNLLDELEVHSPEGSRIQADFCRDFYLTPWICLSQADRLSRSSSKMLIQIKRAIAESGNVLYEETDYDLRKLPQLWIPVVFIFVTEHPTSAYPPAQEIPLNALKVLLNLSHDEIPEAVSSEWNICFSMGRALEKPPLLEKPFQGWIIPKSISSLKNLLDIRVHAHHYRKIESFISNLENPTLKVSVVISTYHREKALREALHSIAHQTFPLADYEVIIVNNDPSDELVHQVEDDMRRREFGAFPEHLRLIQCPLPGLSYARNAGLSEARGEVICFIDDDAIACEDWLEQIWQAFAANSHIGVIGGHIILKYPEARPKILKEGLERFWGQFITSYDSFTEVHDWMEYPWGGNWCARRKVLLEIGGFRGLYGKRKRDFSGGEEIIAASLAQRLGYAIAILPSAAVIHQPPHSRYTFKYLCNTITSQIIIHYRMNRDLYLPKRITLVNNVRGARRFARNFFKILKMPKKQRESLILEYFCYIIAWSRLFFEQMGDAFARFWYQG